VESGKSGSSTPSTICALRSIDRALEKGDLGLKGMLYIIRDVIDRWFPGRQYRNSLTDGAIHQAVKILVRAFNVDRFSLGVYPQSDSKVFGDLTIVCVNKLMVTVKCTQESSDGEAIINELTNIPYTSDIHSVKLVRDDYLCFLIIEKKSVANTFRENEFFRKNCIILAVV